MGIGRNEYIEMMNRSKTGKGIFRKRVAPKLLLPTQPVCVYAVCVRAMRACVVDQEVRSARSPHSHLLINSCSFHLLRSGHQANWSRGGLSMSASSPRVILKYVLFVSSS